MNPPLPARFTDRGQTLCMRLSERRSDRLPHRIWAGPGEGIDGEGKGC